MCAARICIVSGTCRSFSDVCNKVLVCCTGTVKHSRSSAGHIESRQQELADLVDSTACQVVYEELSELTLCSEALAAVLAQSTAPRPGLAASSPDIPTTSYPFDAAVAAAQCVNLSTEPRSLKSRHEPTSLKLPTGGVTADDVPMPQVSVGAETGTTASPPVVSRHRGLGSNKSHAAVAQGTARLQATVSRHNRSPNGEDLTHHARMSETHVHGAVKVSTECTVQPLQDLLATACGAAAADFSTEHCSDVHHTSTQEFLSTLHTIKSPQVSPGQHPWPGAELASRSTDLRALLNAPDAPCAQNADTENRTAGFGSEIGSFEVNRADSRAIGDGCYWINSEALTGMVRAQCSGEQNNLSSGPHGDLGHDQSHFGPLLSAVGRCEAAAETSCSACAGGISRTCEAASADDVPGNRAACRAAGTGGWEGKQNHQGSSVGLPIGRGDVCMGRDLHSVSPGEWDISGLIARVPVAESGTVEGTGGKDAGASALGVQLHALKHRAQQPDDMVAGVVRETENRQHGVGIVPHAVCGASGVGVSPSSGGRHHKAAPRQSTEFSALRNAVHGCSADAASTVHADASASLALAAPQPCQLQHLDGGAVMHADADHATRSAAASEGGARNLHEFRGILKGSASGIPVGAAEVSMLPAAAQKVPAAVPHDAAIAGSPAPTGGTECIHMENSFAPPNTLALKLQLAAAIPEAPLTGSAPQPQELVQHELPSPENSPEMLQSRPSPAQDYTSSLERPLQQPGTPHHTTSSPPAHAVSAEDGAPTFIAVRSASGVLLTRLRETFLCLVGLPRPSMRLRALESMHLKPCCVQNCKFCHCCWGQACL